MKQPETQENNPERPPALAGAHGWAARSNVEPIARDPQCYNCAYAWPNMTGIRGDGWCYMFRERWHACAKKVVPPNVKVSAPAT